MAREIESHESETAERRYKRLVRVGGASEAVDEENCRLGRVPLLLDKQLNFTSFAVHSQHVVRSQCGRHDYWRTWTLISSSLFEVGASAS